MRFNFAFLAKGFGRLVTQILANDIDNWNNENYDSNNNNDNKDNNDHHYYYSNENNESKTDNKRKEMIKCSWKMSINT